MDIFMYQHYCSKFKKNIKIEKKNWDSGTGTTFIGTGTTCAKWGSRHSVPIPHLLVSIPSGQFRAN